MTFNPKFVTNNINPLGKAKTLADIIEDYKAKANKIASAESTVKTASTSEPVVKTALTPAQEKLPEALKNAIKAKEGKGEGEGKEESKKEDKSCKECGKEECSCEKEKEAGSKEAVKVAEKTKKDEAASSGQLDVEPLHQKGESTPTPSKKEEKSTATPSKKESNKDEAASSGQLDPKKNPTNDPKAGEHREGDGDQKKAGSNPRFVKLANLDSKTKNWLKSYWKNIYPAEYVDAMLADK